MAFYTNFRSPDGNRYSLYFYWNADIREWNWNHNWLGNDRGVNDPSALLAILFISLPFLRGSFASVNHEILIKILNDYIQDKNIIELLEKIISSFNTKDKINTGLPLGNLTSQLFINVHLNKFDQFIKHKLKIKCYERYADDFVILSTDRNYL